MGKEAWKVQGLLRGPPPCSLPGDHPFPAWAGPHPLTFLSGRRAPPPLPAGRQGKLGKGRNTPFLKRGPRPGLLTGLGGGLPASLLCFLRMLGGRKTPPRTLCQAKTRKDGGGGEAQKRWRAHYRQSLSQAPPCLLTFMILRLQRKEVFFAFSEEGKTSQSSSG